jgi:hypothetical protein
MPRRYRCSHGCTPDWLAIHPPPAAWRGIVRRRLRMLGEQLARGNRLARVALVQAAIANPEVLAEWLAERKQLAVDVERALFVGGGRLASADDVVRGRGKDARGEALRTRAAARVSERAGQERHGSRDWWPSWLGIGGLRPRAATACRPTRTRLLAVEQVQIDR